MFCGDNDASMEKEYLPMILEKSASTFIFPMIVKKNIYKMERVAIEIPGKKMINMAYN